MAVPWTSGTSSSCRSAGLNEHKMMACPLAPTRAAPDLHRTSDSNSIIRRLTEKTRERAQSNNSRQTRTHYIKITEPPWRDAQPRNICTFCQKLIQAERACVLLATQSRQARTTRGALSLHRISSETKPAMKYVLVCNLRKTRYLAQTPRQRHKMPRAHRTRMPKQTACQQHLSGQANNAHNTNNKPHHTRILLEDPCHLCALLC